MIQVREVHVRLYDPHKYGLLKSKRRLVRATFRVTRPVGGGRRGDFKHENPEQQLRPILPDLYAKLARDPLSPFPFPEKVRADWIESEQAFILRGVGMTGFEVEAVLNILPDEADTTPEIAEGAAAVLHGSELPRLRA